jgi:hypothetical protein
MTDGSDPMAPSGAVNPIDTDYKVGQDNIVVNVGPSASTSTTACSRSPVCWWSPSWC